MRLVVFPIWDSYIDYRWRIHVAYVQVPAQGQTEEPRHIETHNNEQWMPKTTTNKQWRDAEQRDARKETHTGNHDTQTPFYIINKKKKRHQFDFDFLSETRYNEAVPSDKKNSVW